MGLNNTDCLSFPCAAYELRHSSDLALLTKWPVFSQKRIWQPCICQPNELKRESKKKTGWPSKILGGHVPPRPPLELPPVQGVQAHP